MNARVYRRALALLVPALGMLAGATMVATPAQAAPQCTVTYTAGGWDATGNFPAGFIGTFTVTNNTATVTEGWRVEVHYRTGVEVLQNWNAVKLLDVDPTYVFGETSFNREIGPGRSIEFGVQARKTANNVSNYPRSAVCALLF